MPWEWWRWEIVKMTGWTLEYVDALSMGDIREFMQVRDGEIKSRNSLFNRK